MTVGLQIVAAAAACFALWRGWRALAKNDPRVCLITGIGLLLRAFGAQALFWVSWLGLPIARSLQLGNGFWFFAIDAPFYFFFANNLVRHGPPYRYPSHVFVEVYAAFVALFGSVPSVAILLNCAAYLGTCALIIALAQRRAGLPLLLALAAISFGPGAILWSLQPLKDTLFLFLIVAMFGALLWWQKLWRERSGWHAAICAAAMVLLLYAIAGLRWYFAAFIWAAGAVFLLFTGLSARWRWRALAASAALLVVLAESVLVGGRNDIPQLTRWSRKSDVINNTRRNFESAPGATTIAAGPALAPKSAPAPPATRPASATPHPPPRGTFSPPSGEKESAVRHLFTGLVAMFVPRTIAEGLGLVQIGGGRGLWLFVELDTIVFDAVLLFAIVYPIRARARITPLSLVMIMLLVMTALPMAYTVNNFGTLFRLRQMLYALIAILPVTLAPPGAREGGGEPSAAVGRRSDSA